MSHLIIMTTMPDITSAQRLADQVTAQSLAACVNILPEMRSIYYWEGKRRQDTEHQLMIKTRENRYMDIEKLIQDLHPYELPEIIALPVQHGLPDYLAWVTKSCEQN